MPTTQEPKANRYRLWHSQEQCWHYFDLVDLILGAAIPNHRWYTHRCCSTGLTDKNGVEIYEADVVLQTTHFTAGGHAIPEPNKRHIGVVTWDNEGTGYNLTNADGSFLCAFGFTHSDSTILGNIYQNPQLLPLP